MSDPQPKRKRDALRILIGVVLFGTAAQLAATGLFVITSSNARQANCDRVQYALEAYTDALGERLGATPQQKADFLADIEPILSDCS